MSDGLPLTLQAGLGGVEITDLGGVARYLGLPEDATVERISKAVYDGTECGAFLDVLESKDYEEIGPGIAIGSIVEGSDAQATTHLLHYPFNGSDIDHALSVVEEEASELWHIANCHEEGCDDKICQGCKDNCGCSFLEVEPHGDHPGFDPMFLMM